MTASLVGLVGKKRSGKDTFASALVDNGWARVAFADPLKATMLDLDPEVPVKHLSHGSAILAGYWRLSALVKLVGWEAAKEVPEVRRLLQAHGVAIRQHVDPDVWVDAAFQAVDRFRQGDEIKSWDGTLLLDTSRSVVITDVRFPNEAERIKEEGGKLVRIVRPGLDTSDEHISETALDDFPVDITVANDSTVNDLRAKALLALHLP